VTAGTEYFERKSDTQLLQSTVNVSRAGREDGQETATMKVEFLSSGISESW